MEIEKAYHEKKRKLKRSSAEASNWASIQEAYEVLIDVESRKRYDESLGLAARKRTRLDLHPLGFFSKSLSKAQQNWTVWERELLVVIEACEFFRSMVAGCEVHVHTDHLNNTILGDKLSHPDKILRMLLKLESLVRPKWFFAPGQSQFGDGLSRNPEDRDEVRGQSETKSHLPATLAEAFAVVEKRGTKHHDLIDDAEAATQLATSVEEGHRSCSRSVFSPSGCYEAVTAQPPELLNLLLTHGAQVKFARAGLTTRTQREAIEDVPCIYVPSWIEDDNDLDEYERYVVQGKAVTLRSAAVVQPPLVKALGTRRWLEEYTPPPRNQAIRKRYRLTVLDAVLVLLRSLRELCVVGIISHGEGAVVAMCMLSGHARQAAFTERHVSLDEASELEATALQLQFVVLIAPHLLPAKVALPMLRECLPEVATFATSETVQVLVVVPEKDACTKACLECPSSIMNSVVEYSTFPHSAWRRPPLSPLALYYLHPRRKEPRVKSGEKIPNLVVEAWSRKGTLTTACVRLGFVGRAYGWTHEAIESAEPTEAHSTRMVEGDIRRPENQREIEALLQQGKVYQIYCAPSSTTWVAVQSELAVTRTQELPQGDGNEPHEKERNHEMAIAFWIFLQAISTGAYFVFEHPMTSWLWHLPFMKYLSEMKGVIVKRIDKCTWGLRPEGWSPAHGDVRVKDSVKIVTNNPALVALEKHCVDCLSHEHQPRQRKGWDSESVHPECFAQVYSSSTRSAWLHERMPEKIVVPKISLQQLRDNIELDPNNMIVSASSRASRSEHTRIRPVTEATPASSSSASSSSAFGNYPVAGTAPHRLTGGTVRDYWLQTDTHWIRVHEVPRSTFFHPADGIDGPPLHDIKPLRVTWLKYLSGKDATQQHAWDDQHWGKARTKERWTGRSIFIKQEALVPDCGELDRSGIPIRPESTEGMRASLATMRTQLAKAQRQDPRLLEIINHLKGEQLGTYVAEPRSAAPRIRHRALRYRMTTDNVLVARVDGDEIVGDRPVVPDVHYESDAKNAPRRMTWKHVLLAAVHNTATGSHRNAQDMVTELNQLVTWWPPEDLRKDCTTWTGRCKLCSSVHKLPRGDAPWKAVKSYKPFFRLQIDLMEVNPKGISGESFIFTAICVATRYPCLRVGVSQDATSLAEILLDIILDIGVVPVIIQSDNQFAMLALEEMTSLLGSTQIFATALRPQSQGIVERSHRDLRRGLAMLIEAYVRANPRKWPSYVRWLEAKLRHKPNRTGDTPYSAIHGFLGASSLKSSLEAFGQIPEGIIYGDWLAGIVAETKEIESRVAEHWQREAETRARKHEEQRTTVEFRIGDLVLLHKSFYERGAGMILPQCDGPYVIVRRPTDHTVVLEDLLTGEALQKGKPVSVARLIRFEFPSAWAGPEIQETEDVNSLLQSLRVGDFVACEPKTSQFRRVHIARVERIFRAEGQIEVVLMHVPAESRYGPWQRRKWKIWLTDLGQFRKEIITQQELLSQVVLKDDALSTDSLESLAVLGIDIGTQPKKDHSLPPRRR